MPTHIRAQCAWAVGSLLPRHAHTINPCFRVQADWDPLGGTDWDNLANDLGTALQAWAVTGTNHQLTVKLYQIQDPVAGSPNRPKSTKLFNAGQIQATTYPAQVSLCLSFYGGNNDPTQRGRLFLPYWTITGGTIGATPAASEITKLNTLPAALSALGGANVDWIVWSGKLKAATKVTNYFTDNRWDTQRRRLPDPSARTAGTTSG
jgi:hypothetical protein